MEQSNCISSVTAVSSPQPASAATASARNQPRRPALMSLRRPRARPRLRAVGVVAVELVVAVVVEEVLAHLLGADPVAGRVLAVQDAVAVVDEPAVEALE